MQWFKHDTNALTDAKVKKLILRHGAVGYAIYFHCLELIAGDLSANNITFQLEHDAEIIADNLKIQGTNIEAGVDVVNRIMKTILELELFEASGDTITCLKMAKRLDSSMTSNPKMRELVKKSHDTIMIPSCKNRIEKKEENREDKYNPSDSLPFYNDPEFKEVWTDYMAVRTKKKASKSDRAIKGIITKLLDFSKGDKASAIEIITKSADSGWSDIYELKNKALQTSKTEREYNVPKDEHCSVCGHKTVKGFCTNCGDDDPNYKRGE